MTLKEEAEQLAKDRPTSLSDDLYQWAMDAEEMLWKLSAQAAQPSQAVGHCLWARNGHQPCQHVQPSQADAQDAARYRWLRLNTNYEDRGTFRAPNGDLVSPMSRRWYHQTTDLASDTLDSAIDAAINAKESGK